MRVARYFILLGILLAGLISCSSRTVYETPPQSVASAYAININTATAKDLEKLPNIGRGTAEKIIQFREENGPFRRVEYLMQVRGISESRFAEIRHLLRTE